MSQNHCNTNWRTTQFYGTTISAHISKHNGMLSGLHRISSRNIEQLRERAHQNLHRQPPPTAKYRRAQLTGRFIVLGYLVTHEVSNAWISYTFVFEDGLAALPTCNGTTTYPICSLRRNCTIQTDYMRLFSIYLVCVSQESAGKSQNAEDIHEIQCL